MHLSATFRVHIFPAVGQVLPSPDAVDDCTSTGIYSVLKDSTLKEWDQNMQFTGGETARNSTVAFFS